MNVRHWAAMAALALAPAAQAGVRVEGTELVLPGADGERRGAAVAGSELELPGFGVLRIAAAALDEGSRFADIWLYRAELADGSPVCAPDPSGDTRLVFFAGRFDAAMDYVPDPAEFSISCVSGVQAKCLRWGYRPWARAPVGDADLGPYYNACLRAARADYCGDDQPTTRDGTTIDLYDRVGVQKPESDPAEFPFEAGWGAHGAVCVQHPRIADNASLDSIAAACPRLRAAPLGAGCDETRASELGALLYNRSRSAPAVEPGHDAPAP